MCVTLFRICHANTRFGCNIGVNCGVPVHKILPTPSAQHIVVLPLSGDPQLWHAMSNTLVHTFKGK